MTENKIHELQRVLIVFGTRPEAIKMAPIVNSLRRHSNIALQVCVTGQHREMLDQVLQLFAISPTYDLQLMRPGQTLHELTCGVLIGLQKVLYETKPHIVLVHGDTTTTFAASLAAFYEQIAVGHVEAGLRTHQKYAPWPEEMNRKLTSAIADVHFAPTELAKGNLTAEGVAPTKIILTGNTVIDSLFQTVEMINESSELREEMERRFSYLDKQKRLILVTGHRRENFGDGFMNICYALSRLAERNDIEIVYPVHLNPQVQEPVLSILGKRDHIHLISPLDYCAFVYLLQRCSVVITDSGGIQEEAPALGKPVLVMRDATERPEAIAAGTAQLVGTNEDQIYWSAMRLLDDEQEYIRMSSAQNPYGDGMAATRIADWLAANLPLAI